MSVGQRMSGVVVIICGLIVALEVTAGARPKEVGRIVAQAGAPLEITEYTPRYWDRVGNASSHIAHSVRFKNTSGKTVTSVKFGFVDFNVFNEFLNRVSGYTMDDVVTGNEKRASWENRTYGDFSFMTGVVFIEKVRFDNGEIWAADMGVVLDELKKIQVDFDAQDLREHAPQATP